MRLIHDSEEEQTIVEVMKNLVFTRQPLSDVSTLDQVFSLCNRSLRIFALILCSWFFLRVVSTSSTRTHKRLLLGVCHSILARFCFVHIRIRGLFAVTVSPVWLRHSLGISRNFKQESQTSEFLRQSPCPKSRIRYQGKTTMW